MLCKKCNIPMKSGTTYERKDKRGISKRYDECPKCHFRKYNSAANSQETLVEVIEKSRSSKYGR